MEKNKKDEVINRCKCCLEEIGLKGMWKEYYSEGEREIYGEMLTDCFALSWTQPSNIDSEYICDTCIARLRDALSFKKEILYTEHLHLERLKKEGEVSTIKQEEESEQEIETEYLNIDYLEETDTEREKPEIKIEVPILKDDTDEPIIQIEKAPRYTEEDLEKCLEAVRSKALSQSKASVVYNIPRRTISAAFAKKKNIGETSKTKKRGRPDLQKRQENLDIIMQYTNATPFKGFQRTGYACFFCSVELENPGHLKEHTLVEHCSHNIERVVVSERSIKLDLTDLMCKLCEESIDSLENLLDHLRLDHSKNIHTDVFNHLVPFKFDSDNLKCVVCHEEFVSFKLLNDHVNFNHYKNYECKECGRGFITSSSLQSHMYRHENGIFTCKYCAKVFSSRVRRAGHERAVHMCRNKRYKCGYCGEMFRDMERKKDHEVVVHSAAKQTYQCQSCSKVYNTHRALKNHVGSFHLLLRPFKCTFCGMGFYKNIQLKHHLVKHTGEKHFKCDVCKKKFGRKSTLREHMRIHADDRRFKCEFCELSFVQKHVLRGHVQAKHGQQV